MSAILLGAGETIASELRDECKGIILELLGNRLYISSAGPKALLVLRGELGVEYSQHSDVIRSSVKELSQLL
jgi:predicted regulator of Ras-like GTPase activity (Roadblock/LC7/MglB family)